MTDTRSPGLDPRYDPAFQRGSGSSRNDEPPRRPESPRAVVEERSADFRSLSERSESKGILETADVPVLDADRSESAPPSHRGELAILIAGIVLIVAGLGLTWWWVQRSFTGFSFSGNEPPIEYLVIQFASQVAAPMLTVGLAAIVTWLVLRVTRARRAT